MENQNTIAIVLAAGQGKRMNSELPKVANLLAGKPLIIWVLESLISAHIKNIIPVISPTQNLVKGLVTDHNLTAAQVHFAYQDKQLGTAHAVNCGLKVVENFFQEGIPPSLKIIIAYGDTPGIKPATFKKLEHFHNCHHNSFTVLAFKTDNPYGYGRIIMDDRNEFIAIREQKDCCEKEANIQICNSGILCANYYDFIKILPLIKNENSAKEYYLTDTALYAKEQGLKIGLMIEDEENQFLGINTQEQLKHMEKLFQNKK